MTLTLVKDLQTELQHFEKLLTEKEKRINKEMPEKCVEKPKEHQQYSKSGTFSYHNFLLIFLTHVFQKYYAISKSTDLTNKGSHGLARISKKLFSGFKWMKRKIFCSKAIN